MIAVRSSNQPPGATWGTRVLTLRRWRHWLKLQARYWLAPHQPYRPLFVLATYRSGSNLLVDYLSSLPGVQCYAEVLSPRLPIGPGRTELTPQQALRHIRYSLQSLRMPVRGCKLMLDQLAASRLSVDDLREAFPEARFIVLYRESLVEQLLSIRTAQATNQWIVRRGEAPRRARVRIEPVELRWYCSEVRRQYASLLETPWLRERSVLLSYEELTADPRGIFAERICPLLATRYDEPRTRLRKQNPQPLSERVENYDQIADLVASPQCRQHYAWSDTTAGVRAA